MFERFGELESYKEINTLAENLFNEGDELSLYALAKENGIPKDFVDMYLQGDIPELVDAQTAAVGKLDIEIQELKPQTIMKDWTEYIKVRKDIKKPMSDRAITLMMNKLESLSHDKHEQVQILNQSIMQGWTGLYALKDDGKSRGQPRNVNPNGFANFKQTDHSEQLGQLEKMLADELNNNK